MSLLEINDLVVRYPGRRSFRPWAAEPRSYVTILPGVSIALEAGETLGLIGESGSGKTTLGRAVVGLTPMAHGTVSVAGDIASGTKDAAWTRMRRAVGLMFQDPAAALDPRMTLGASVTEPLAVAGVPPAERRRRAGELLTEVGLSEDFVARYPHQISGGQARRVTVARALSLRPKLVVADEPTAGLDLSVQGELLNLLNDLQRTLGIAFLIITHNLAVARHVTDRIAILYLGRIVESGRTADIFARPAHPYTRALLGARAAGGAPLAGDVPSLASRPGGCEFHTRCPIAEQVCRQYAPGTWMVGRQHHVTCHFPPAGTPVLPGGATAKVQAITTTSTTTTTAPPEMEPAT